MTTGGDAGPPTLSALVARRWLLVFLPANAATSGFSVVLPLIILFTLHENILVVALAQTVYNVAIIPASMAWGVICDRLKVRSSLLILNYTAAALLFLLLSTGPNVTFLLAAYGAYGLIAPASASASNLLILERFSVVERPAAYASFSELSIIGSCLGIVVGFLWLLRYPSASEFPGFLVLTGLLSLSSAVGVALFIRDGPRRKDRAFIHLHADSLRVRLAQHIPYFPHAIRRGFFGRAARWFREEATHEVPLIIVAGFLFTIASFMFNTAYTPYLQGVGIAASSIFLVNLSNNAAQAIVLPFTARACAGSRSERVVIQATWARGAGYAVGGIMAISPFVTGVVFGGTALGANLVLYGFLGAGVGLYGTASTLLLFRSLEGRNAGSLLGANSAFTALASVLGAATAGVVSFRLGFDTTFLIAAGILAASVPLWALATQAYHRRIALGVPAKVIT